ncbi:MAG: hypothetical protein IPF57_24695, partial [Gammaproteobacteria bacterium]|nr:hypothetical protein [Gammaproteobacteria bacterium]
MFFRTTRTCRRWNRWALIPSYNLGNADAEGKGLRSRRPGRPPASTGCWPATIPGWILSLTAYDIIPAAGGIEVDDLTGEPRAD